MRIISGTHKGRQIHPPANFKARPTTDIAREGLFNILNNMFDFEEIKVADLFGGTGAVSFEFCSRGVPEVYCIEMEPANYRFIKKTYRELGFDQIKLYRNNAFYAIPKLPKSHFDIVFADPPFNMKNKEKIITDVMESGVLKDGYFILEHSDKEQFNTFQYYSETRRYGKVSFSFFKIN